MTENDTLDLSEDGEREVQRSTSKRSGGALIGRFLAVGLFVALGTFAVIQSLAIGTPEANEEISETESDIADSMNISIAKNDPPATDPKFVEPKPIVRTSSTFGSSAANKKPSMPQVSPPIVAKGTSSGTFATTLKPATPPVVAPPKQPIRTVPVVAPIRQTATPPPNRIAQLDTGSVRSTFGIGGPATTGETVGGTLNSLKQSAGGAAQSAANRFNQATQGVSNKAAEVSSQTRAAFDNATNRFNTAGQTAKPATPPFQRPANTLQKIEARSSLDSLKQSRPFAADENKGSGFRSQSLNPISKSSSGFRRTPEANPAPSGRTFPAKTAVAKPKQTDAFGSNRSSAQRNDRFPARKTTSASLPSSNSRAPVMQASRVSAKPGDRQYEGVQSPSMIIQKFSPQEIQVNQTADFEIKIRNVGRVAVDDVLVVDRVPDGARFIDANPKPTSQSRTGELQWQLGTMNPGQERTVLLQLEPTEPGEIGSVAQFYFGSRATNRTKVTQPKLRITHTSDPKVLIGNNVVFDVTIENTGNGPAKDVVIQEEVPELLEYQDGSRELEYEVGTLLPGQSRRVQLGLRAARVGRFKNVMFASAKGGLQSKDETDVEIIAPKLTTSSEGPTRRYIRRKVTHTFTVGNTGTAAATNLRLIARLPSGLRFVDANNRGRYDRNTHSIVWQMRDLAAGGTGDVEIVTTPVEGGEQPIKFEAEADLDQRSETVQQLAVEHLIDVFFDIDDVVDPIEVGAETRYKIRMVNQGTQNAANVQLQVDFPAGLQPTEVEGDLRNQIRGQQILFEPISSLRPGEELNVTVVATGRSPGDHRIVVNMKADGRDTPVSKEETTRVYSDR